MTKKLSFSLGFLIPLFLMMVVVLPAHADCNVQGGLPNPLGATCTITQLLDKILTTVIVPIGAVAATIAIIYSGFLFVSAQGNEEKLQTAKTTFMWTVIGVAVLLGAKVLSAGIKETFDQLKLNN